MRRVSRLGHIETISQQSHPRYSPVLRQIFCRSYACEVGFTSELTLIPPRIVLSSSSSSWAVPTSGTKGSSSTSVSYFSTVRFATGAGLEAAGDACAACAMFGLPPPIGRDPIGYRLGGTYRGVGTGVLGALETSGCWRRFSATFLCFSREGIIADDNDKHAKLAFARAGARASCYAQLWLLAPFKTRPTAAYRRDAHALCLRVSLHFTLAPSHTPTNLPLQNLIKTLQFQNEHLCKARDSATSRCSDGTLC